MRAWKYRLQVATRRFRSDEPEFRQLADWVHPWDSVLDVGANVGQYKLRLSELAGEEGRVIAFEPIIETFEILAAMARRARYRNITLFNIAVSERAGVLRFGVRIPNYFQARVGLGDRAVLCCALDELPVSHRIALVKIDVEEHEVSVIRGISGVPGRRQECQRGTHECARHKRTDSN